MASNAVGTERVSQVVGYQLTGADFSEVTPNLPQRIVVLGEANTANQTGLTYGKQIASAEEAGNDYGFGSPIYNVLRILKPINGGGVQGIPVIVYHELEDGAPVAQVETVTFTGSPTAPGLQKFRINGRADLDGQSYSFVAAVADTVTQTAAKLASAINNVLGSPYIAVAALGVVTLTAKWKGATSDDCSIELDADSVSVGLTTVIASATAGSGDPDTATALAAFDDSWNTILINCHDLSNATILTLLENKNGKPSATTPTGNYSATIMRPFVALTGTTSDDVSALTDARKDEVTISACPAPNSKGLPMEAAANVAALVSRTAQDNPHLDTTGMSYPDMPIPIDLNIGAMATYDNRDIFVKKGSSTVILTDSKFYISDLVTTYHPTGVLNPQHRYVRDLILDFNVYFGYYLLVEAYVVGHVIVSDDDDVEAAKVIKPKIWIGILDEYAEGLSKRALITDKAFMQDSIVVNLGVSNPNRLETFFRYKRSGTVRISSTTAEAGFNFGS